MANLKKMISSSLSFVSLIIYLTISFNAQSFVASTHDLGIILESGINENIYKTLSSKPGVGYNKTGIGVATGLALDALFQNIPLIIPAPLWNNILAHKNIFDDFTTLSINELLSKYKKNARFATRALIQKFKNESIYAKKSFKILSESRQKGALMAPIQEKIVTDLPDDCNDIELSLFTLCAMVPAQNFTVKKLEEPNHKALFYLFIPKSLKDSGLREERYTTLTDPLEAEPLSDQANYFDSLVPVLEKLLSTNITKDSPRWAIYLMGHGIYSDEAKEELEVYKKIAQEPAHKSNRKRQEHALKEIEQLRTFNKVAGMPLDMFSRLLTFLKEKTATKLLLVSSCSAGGKQWVDAYSQDGKQMCLPYTVIIDTLSEAPAMTVLPTLFLNVESPSITLSPYNFKQFFSSARSPHQSAEELETCISSLCPGYQTTIEDFGKDDVNNLPSIRLAHTTWFSLVDSCKKLLEITKKGNHATKPETLVAGFAVPEIGTLTHKSNDDFPALISLIPGNAHHICQKLEAPSISLTDIISSWFTCDELAVCKMLTLEKLICYDNIWTKKVREFNDITIFNKVVINGLYKNGVVSNGAKEFSALWSPEKSVPRDLASRIRKGSKPCKLTAWCPLNTLRAIIPHEKAMVTTQEIAQALQCPALLPIL